MHILKVIVAFPVFSCRGLWSTACKSNSPRAAVHLKMLELPKICNNVYCQSSKSYSALLDVDLRMAMTLSANDITLNPFDDRHWLPA